MLLQAMGDIFALTRIHSDILFRNDDYVAAEKAKAVQKLIERLSGSLRNVAVPLVGSARCVQNQAPMHFPPQSAVTAKYILQVDAFAIPDHILRAPIGLQTPDGDPYAVYLRSIGWN